MALDTPPAISPVARAIEVSGNEALVEFRFADDQNLTVNVEDFPDHILTLFLLRGAITRLRASYAGTTTDEEARAALLAEVAQLKSGKWRASRARADGIYLRPHARVLAEALAIVSGRPLEDAKQVVERMSRSDREKLKRDPRIGAALAQIKLNTAEATVALDEIFDGPSTTPQLEDVEAAE